MSSMLALLPDNHKPCFFLHGAFLNRLPADIRAHLLRIDFTNIINWSTITIRVFPRKKNTPIVQRYSDFKFFSEYLFTNYVKYFCKITKNEKISIKKKIWSKDFKSHLKIVPI